MSRKYTKKKLDGLSFEEFRRSMKEGRVESLYLFAGEEQYLQERALRLLSNTLDEAGRAFNFSVFSIGEQSAGGKVTAWTAIETANQMPMMSARRVVVIRDFDKVKDDENDLILEYLKKPSPTTTVVFQAVSLDQRRKLTSVLMKTCTVVAFDRLTEQQTSRWAEEFLKRRDCRIEPNALGHLVGLAARD